MIKQIKDFFKRTRRQYWYQADSNPDWLPPSAAIKVSGSDRFNYICEAGHRIVSSDPYYRTCDARSENPDGPYGPPCGADIEWRLFPMNYSFDDADFVDRLVRIQLARSKHFTAGDGTAKWDPEIFPTEKFDK